MKKIILLSTAALMLLTVCADRERKNPLDPKNPNSNRDRVVLVELFTSDTPIYYDTTYTPYIASVKDTVADTTTVTTPGTLAVRTLTVHDTVTPAFIEDTTVYTTLDTSLKIMTTLRCTLMHDTLVAYDTLQQFAQVESLVEATAVPGEIIAVEYHFDDDYTCTAADTVFTAYQAGASIPAASHAAAYFNGTGNPADMSDTNVDISVHASAFNTALPPTGRTGYYTIEGELSVSNPDTVSTTFTTDEGTLTRLGSDTGDSVKVRYIFTRYLNASHPFVVVATAENVQTLAAPEAGETYKLQDRTVTVGTAIGTDYSNVIIVVQDAATGEVLQAISVATQD